MLNTSALKVLWSPRVEKRSPRQVSSAETPCVGFWHFPWTWLQSPFGFPALTCPLKPSLTLASWTLSVAGTTWVLSLLRHCGDQEDSCGVGLCLASALWVFDVWVDEERTQLQYCCWGFAFKDSLGRGLNVRDIYVEWPWKRNQRTRTC